MQRNYLSGSLPGKMGRMASLEVVRLGYNRLSGPLPVKWGHMATLRLLDLRGNALSGVLPMVSRFGLFRGSCHNTLLDLVLGHTPEDCILGNQTRPKSVHVCSPNCLCAA